METAVSLENLFQCLANLTEKKKEKEGKRGKRGRREERGRKERKGKKERERKAGRKEGRKESSLYSVCANCCLLGNYLLITCWQSMGN